jgi:predicted lipid-binding transport protein (Tim44 family)
MPNKSVSCIATSREQASQITQRIKTVNFSGNDISVQYPDRREIVDSAKEQNSRFPEGTLVGASLGGIIIGLLGWGGTLPIPVTGHFIAALIGAIAGVTLGGLLGGLIGLGIPERDAGYYQEWLEPCKILISVHAKNMEEIARAKETFAQAGALDIRTIDEAADPQ